MPRFKVKEMLLATTFIAIGTGLLAFQFQNANEIFNRNSILLLWFGGGGACIGAGLFTPFKRPWIGAYVGFLLQLLLAFLGRS